MLIGTFAKADREGQDRIAAFLGTFQKLGWSDGPQLSDGLLLGSRQLGGDSWRCRGTASRKPGCDRGRGKRSVGRASSADEYTSCRFHPDFGPGRQWVCREPCSASSSIVMTGSVTGLLGNRSLLDYSMTKGAFTPLRAPSQPISLTAAFGSTWSRRVLYGRRSIRRTSRPKRSRHSAPTPLCDGRRSRKRLLPPLFFSRRRPARATSPARCRQSSAATAAADRHVPNNHEKSPDVCVEPFHVANDALFMLRHVARKICSRLVIA